MSHKLKLMAVLATPMMKPLALGAPWQNMQIKKLACILCWQHEVKEVVLVTMKILPRWMLWVRPGKHNFWQLLKNWVLGKSPF